MFSSFRRMRGISAPVAFGRVIVADGDEATYGLVRQLTAPDLWQISYASDAESFRQELHSGQAQLAVVNLALVDEDLAEELIERTSRGLSVVVLADEHSDDNERAARLLGPVAYAPKPVHLLILKRVLDGALDAAVAKTRGAQTW